MYFAIRKHITATIACLGLAGCTSPPQYDSEYKAQFESGNPAPTQMFASGYFPASFGEPNFKCEGFDNKTEVIGEVERGWFPRQWKAAREPSLHLLAEQQTPPEFALRFTYLPSFAPSVFIRVQKYGDEYRVIAKQMDGLGGYDAGKIARSKSVPLSSEQARELEALLQKERLFSEAADKCAFGFDGTRWIFELVDPQGYKLVKRHSPTGGAAYNLGKHLIRLAGWDIDKTCLRPFPYPFNDLEVLCR